MTIRKEAGPETFNFILFFLLCFLLLSNIAEAGIGEKTFEQDGEINLIKITFNFLAGLALFLFGITQLSNGIKSIAKEKVKEVMSKFTTNRFAGVLTGFFASTILDSSSVTIIMVIAFVNAGVLTSLQSLGVVLGANLGTTISSQIVAFNLYQYSPIAMLIGFLLYSVKGTKKMKKIGLIVFGTGMIFFGLKEMGEAMHPLKNSTIFLEWMKDVETPLIGVLVGAVFTIVIQSSSATLGVLITLANQGMISLPAGVAIMMGAEIGTCADTLVATIGRSREAIKVGTFHLIFNVISVLLGLILFEPFVELVQWTSLHTKLTHQIANAHLLFNLLGVVIFIGFTPWMSEILNKALKMNQYSKTESKVVKKKSAIKVK